MIATYKHFDRDDIETREFLVMDDKIFFSDDELNEYLNSCKAEFDTENFFGDHYDMLEVIDEDELRGEMSEEDFEELCYYFDVTVENLIDKYDIRAHKYPGNDMRYSISGTYGNLKKFCEEYSNDLQQSNAGEPLSDFEMDVYVDLESGDEDQILGRLSM